MLYVQKEVNVEVFSTLVVQADSQRHCSGCKGAEHSEEQHKADTGWD